MQRALALDTVVTAAYGSRPNEGDGSMQRTAQRTARPRPAARICVLALAMSVLAPAHPAGAAAPGLVDVGGRRMAAACSVGTAGHPTVVLEPGLGTAGLSSDTLVPLVNALAEVTAGGTRVCRSGRAGLGASDPAPGPRSYRAVVEDLRSTLVAAGAPPPYVLVGLSSGGVVSQLYAGWYPQEVAGLVLVNAPVYGQTELIGQILPSPEREAFLRAALAGAAAEGLEAAGGNAEHRALQAPRGLPVAVVSPAPGWGWPEDFSPQAVAEASNFWSELQGELLHMWPGATHVTARGSGHDVARDEPEAIVAALRAVLAVLERGSTHA